MLTGTRWYTKLGFVLVLLAIALTLAHVVSAETLQCWPAHTPYRASASVFDHLDPELFAIVCAIGAILFMM